MIAASRPVLIGALGIALAAHGLGLHGAFEKEDVQMEGDSGAVQAALGSSFADMVAGMEVSQDAEDVTEPDQPVEDVTDPVEPEQTVQETTPDEVQQQPAEVEEAAEDVPVEDLIETEITPLPVETVIPILPMQPTEVQPTQVAQPQPAETIESVEENTSAVARSLRPQQRTPEFEKKHERQPEPQPRQQVTQPREQPTQQPRQQTVQGAEQNATAGAATGTQQQSNTRSGTGTSTQTGNAAVSNYPGKVMRRLSRVSKPRGVGRGTTVVAFRVSSSGGLSGASIARSSGNPNLDQAALNVVRRAAPFPPPPPGAQTSFSINIKGR
ncbi:MAG: TonB family protein [Pseudomonadota bacterium]